ncbi:glycosyltransferase [Stygiolobus caldivivus]|uniref:Glycosyltransferase 2-like domain-containing protein n=1 Tax=Stygiolobus caldivivus TaxID=2824673 RepID=A0A8D5ZI55_9CREN|nr:glycosyltransferase [Stygiolobus caldivivus]BCU69150.1 hypothetical protein KN1_04470 [Stygiolobus caldivivus]
MLSFISYGIFIISSALLTVSYFILNTHYGLKYKPKIVKELKYSISDVTALIPVYNEELSLFEKVIKSVSELGIKFIVIGDGVRQPYESLVKKYRGTYIYLKKRSGKRIALSEGIKHVDTPLVLLLDSDTIISKRSLEALLSHLDENVGGVGANIRMLKDGSKSSYYADFFERMSELVNRAVNYFGSAIILSGQCVLYRTSVIKPYLLSDEFKNPRILGRKLVLSDDRDLTEYIILKGYRAIKAIDAIVYTKPPSNIRIFAKQVTRWTRANYLIFFKEIKEGTIGKRGLMYSFNVLYLNTLPILSILFLFFDIHSLFTSHLFQKLLEDKIFYDILTKGFQIEPIMIKINIIINHFVHIRPTFLAIILITHLLPTLSIIPFTYALARLIGTERLKTFALGTIALVVQYFASFYALITFWEQSWSSRDS